MTRVIWRFLIRSSEICCLSGVYMEKLQPFIEKRRKDGVKAKTINLSLEAVRRILRLAALEWRDERGMTWLETAPKIKLFGYGMLASRIPSRSRNRKFCFANCRFIYCGWHRTR